MSDLTDSVWETPVVADFAIFLGHLNLLMLLNFLVEANIDKALLVKEGLLTFGNHLLASGLHAEARSGSDQDSAWWQVSLLLHLPQIGIQLWLVLWV